ncbi:sigma factor-like helix-turn-helix DNA-binding protein [Arthrobacter sp. 35W]|uniref:sigma factor-like helix-turn-helix DNA-binding protein n=1 Tax=Arthrobacter sp. 35W TaxID=1132441 RepID=UPI00047D1A96|nr:sigma factor-like helix-turn-helix DNA-binding protein [Arthrobacter sp. 35W]
MTTVELTKDERNAVMVERYSDGETLDAIGQSFGVTRERVRQIISKLGGTNAEESRRKRLEARTVETQTARQLFMDRFGNLALQLANRGITRSDAIVKLKTVFPTIDVDLADDALRDSKIVFDKAPSEEIFSAEAIAAGIWYLLGSDLGLAPDFEYAVVCLDLALMDELKAALSTASVGSEDIATILGVIGAAQKYALTEPKCSITHQRYDQLRNELVGALGLVSRQGSMPWPPTHQTVIKRLNGWNNALQNMGIGTSPLGRGKGLVKFTQTEYTDAVQDYCMAMEYADTRATAEGYDTWVKSEASSGRSRPTLASVRNVYSTWNQAVRECQG